MTSQRSRLVLCAALFFVNSGLALGENEAPERSTFRSTVTSSVRRPQPKLSEDFLRLTEDTTGRLVVKLTDDVRGRVMADGRLASLAGADIGNVHGIISRYRLTVRQAINHSVEDLAALEARAFGMSGEPQPYLAGILHITGPESTIEQAAIALNRLPDVEWVVFETARPGNDIVPSQTSNNSQRPSDAQIEQARVRRLQEIQAKAVLARAARRAPEPEPALQIERADGEIMEIMEAGVPGACCLGDSCFLLEPDICAQVGGTPFNGPCDVGGFCGACCLPNGSCEEQYIQTACLSLGGTYPDDGSQCATACPVGVCCLPDETCIDMLTDPQCTTGLGGAWLENADCENTECDLDCGELTAGDCFDPAGNPTPFCDDQDCCDDVCTLDPFCCDDDDGGWDEFCAAAANEVCRGRDPCLSQWSGNCFEEFGIDSFNRDALQGGCANFDCCNAVRNTPGFEHCDGSVFPFYWDIRCANLAKDICEVSLPVGGVTPDYEPLQGYLTANAWFGPEFTVLAPYLPINPTSPGPAVGYGGDGWALLVPGEPFTDLNGDEWRNEGEPYDDFGRDGVDNTFDEGEGNGRWDEPTGLRGIGEQLLHQDPPVDAFGLGNLTSGRTIHIGVIADAYWPDHEDLNTTTERGQTMLLIEELTFPDIGTGVLSIINARDNGKGVTGVAPDSTTTFYPLISLEQGAREVTAWVSALADSKPGDVICAAYSKVDGIWNVNNSPETAAMIRMATALGVTTCIAAGDRCSDVSTGPDQGRTGGLVVGACSPGSPNFRLPQSNYTSVISPAVSGTIHMKGWGANVACAGFGDLQPRGETNRSYTAHFRPTGTLAAVAQAAGLIANYQGMMKQFYGTYFVPAQFEIGLELLVEHFPLLRETLNGGFNTIDPGINCGPDIDPDGGPNWISDFDYALMWPFGVNRLLTQSFIGYDRAPLVDDVVVVRGRNVVGNVFSIKGLEGNNLSFDPVYTRRNDGPLEETGEGGGGHSGIDVPEIQSITYLGTGDITDMVVVAHSDLEVVNTLIVEEWQTEPGVFTLHFVELYDWRNQRWTFNDFSILDPLAEPNGFYQMQHITTLSQRFVRADDGRILVRMWTLGFANTGIGEGEETYRRVVDLVNVFVAEEFGEQLP